MDPFHQRLARIALEAAAGYGFCLAGGYAVQAHGFVDRVSKDVDLFATMVTAAEFPAAQAAVSAVRDYIDVHGVLKDGRYTGPEQAGNAPFRGLPSTLLSLWTYSTC